MWMYTNESICDGLWCVWCFLKSTQSFMGVDNISKTVMPNHLSRRFFSQFCERMSFSFCFYLSSSLFRSFLSFVSKVRALTDGYVMLPVCSYFFIIFPCRRYSKRMNGMSRVLPRRIWMVSFNWCRFLFDDWTALKINI